MNFKSLKQLREAVVEVRQKMDAIYDRAEKEGRSLTSEEQTQLGQLQRRHGDAELELMEYTAELEGASRSIAAESMREIKAAKVRRAANDTTLGRWVRAMKGLDLEFRGNTSANTSNIINDPVISDNIIHSLYANNPLTAAGVEMLRLENNTQMGKITGTAGQWVPEGTQVNDVTLTVSGIKWDFKDVAILCRVQNQVLYDSSGRAERAITEALRRSINDTLLKAVLYGDSGSNEPDGLDNIAGVQTVDALEAPLDYFLILDAYRKILDANGNADNISLFGNPVAWRQLAGLVGGDSQPLMEPQGVAQMRKFWTTAAKTDYGTGNDLQNVYVGDFSNLVIGFQGAFEMRLEERYADYLQTAFLVHLRADVQALHPATFVRIENVATTVPVQGN